MNDVAPEFGPGPVSASVSASASERNGGLLVLGYGNAMRGDDGVGPAVAEAVGLLGLERVRVETCHQLTPEWVDVLEQARGVVFVDALDAQEGDRVVVRELEPVGAEGTGWTGHRMTPEVLVALTRDLFGRSPQAWCVGIPVRKFGWGPGLSEQARAGVAAGVEAIREVWSVCMKRAS